MPPGILYKEFCKIAEGVSPAKISSKGLSRCCGVLFLLKTVDQKVIIGEGGFILI